MPLNCPDRTTFIKCFTVLPWLFYSCLAYKLIFENILVIHTRDNDNSNGTYELYNLYEREGKLKCIKYFSPLVSALPFIISFHLSIYLSISQSICFSLFIFLSKFMSSNFLFLFCLKKKKT